MANIQTVPGKFKEEAKQENHEIIDQDLYKKLLEYGINKTQFDEMIEKVKVYASYDDNNADIGFPYEQWIGRLLEKYE